MKSIILAAGQGTRLRPYTDDRPKCMVQIDGKSLLERQLSILKMQSWEKIIVVGGYLADKLPDKNVDIRINDRYAETNMVWTLYSVLDELSGDVVVSYGDIVYSKEVLERLLNSSADIAVAIDKEWKTYWQARNESPLEDAETLRLDESGRILEVGQKPKSFEDIQGQYMGLIKLTAHGSAIIKEIITEVATDGALNGVLTENAYMTDLLQEAINRGHDVCAVNVSGNWVEVDTVSDMELPITIERLHEIESGI